MNVYYTVKHGLKLVRWRIRRAEAAMRWGAEALDATPIVFGNAMPKSGSHLLAQILRGLVHLGPFVNPGFPPANRSEANITLPEERIAAELRRMRPGDIRYGYIKPKEPYLSILTGPNRATIFTYRDPRDMLVSHVFYATEMYPGHGMHRYYTERLTSMEARLNAAIEGVTEPGFELSSVRKRYQSYWGWFGRTDILHLRFEDLVTDREAALGRLLDYLETFAFRAQLPREQAIETLKAAIAPEKSGTFRKGETGGWRQHFTAENKARFKEVAGDLLIQLGYETDNDW
jgi:hypothetical protein